VLSPTFPLFPFWFRAIQQTILLPSLASICDYCDELRDLLDVLVHWGVNEWYTRNEAHWKAIRRTGTDVTRVRLFSYQLVE
jgi:hypothetical protein